MGRTKLASANGRAYFLIHHLNILALLLFIGCSKPTDTLPYPLMISEDGLGAIHPKQPYDFASLNSALPGFDLMRFDSVSSEETQHLIILKRGSSHIARLFISPDQKRIEEISILSAEVKNRYGKGIDDILTVTEALNCTSEICRYSDEPSLFYKIDLSTRRIVEITYRKL